MRSLFQIVRRIRRDPKILASYPVRHRKKSDIYRTRRMLMSILNAFVGARALLIVVHRDDYSRRFSSFRFRFPHVLRMPENVQVADGPEPARARGMRQNLVYLSVLSQHHANEVQSIESPEEGARLLRFNSASDCRRTILLFASQISIDVYSFLDCSTTL